MDIEQKIKDLSAEVAVIGLGYVGLPLALLFGKKGFPVIGIEREPKKIEALLRGQSYIRDVTAHDLGALIKQQRLKLATSMEGLPDRNFDVAIICVPTPLNGDWEPDLSELRDALSMVAQQLRPGHLVVLESTSYPGTTEEIALGELVKKGYRVGADFFLAYSPERIDPGQHAHVEDIPKLVAGCTSRCTSVAALLYRQVVQKVTTVSSPKVAEMAKLLENTFRSVNIALVEELAIAAHTIGIDFWEAIQAASTKPFGFMPFYPGPGVGGHCLPVDPVYLAWQVKKYNYVLRLVETSNLIHREMPAYVVDRLRRLLIERRSELNGAKILVLGVTYKKDVEDLREAPALDIISLLVTGGAQVSFHDPFISQLKIGSWQEVRCQLDEDTLASQDCVIIITDHSAYDYTWLVKHSRLLFDTRNATAQTGIGAANVYKL